MKVRLTSFMVILSILMIFVPAAQAAPAGKVTNIDGRVDVTAPGQQARALSIGDTVNVGDIIRTKSASKCEVTWVDGSVARLSENSRLQVTEFMLAKEKRSVSFNLFRGKMQNIVKTATQLFGGKGESKYEVHTPTAVCGVRGTNFFIYHQAGTSGAIFTEGQGYGFSKGKPNQVKSISSGQAMVVTSANKAPVVKTATPAE
ncbi:MAG: FecR family protein, partial [Syntrophales bacterium LBB04]|nr:FecR family protein [Syntrophales bacterium LBB04]